MVEVFPSPRRAGFDVHARNITIGILGGSNSAGSVVAPHQTYARLLARMPCVQSVLNRAVPAAGSMVSSYCSGQMLPESVDVLVLEFAPNDAAGGSQQIFNGPARLASGAASMERLLRNVLLHRAGTLPLLLHATPASL